MLTRAANWGAVSHAASPQHRAMDSDRPREPATPAPAPTQPAAWERPLLLVLITSHCLWLLTGWGGRAAGGGLMGVGLVWAVWTFRRDYRRGLLTKTWSQLVQARPRADRLELVATILGCWVVYRVTGGPFG